MYIFICLYVLYKYKSIFAKSLHVYVCLYSCSGGVCASWIET